MYSAHIAHTVNVHHVPNYNWLNHCICFMQYAVNKVSRKFCLIKNRSPLLSKCNNGTLGLYKRNSIKKFKSHIVQFKINSYAAPTSHVLDYVSCQIIWLLLFLRQNWNKCIYTYLSKTSLRKFLRHFEFLHIVIIFP